MVAKKCPGCGKVSDEDLDFCIYCGTFFEEPKEQEEDFNLFVYKTKDTENTEGKKQVVRLREMPENVHPLKKRPQHRLAIILGYVFAILGGAVGFIFAIYLLTRKDPIAKRHGLIQLIILIIEYAMVAIMIMNGQIDMNMILNPFNMTNMDNMSQLYNSSQMNLSGSENISSLFGF